MPGLKYYYDLMSQPCRAVYIFLKMNNIPFEENAVALRKGRVLHKAKVKYKVFRCGNVIGNVTNHFCLYLSNLLILTKYNINYF